MGGCARWLLTAVNSEDRLVQATFAEHLEQKLGWKSVYAWNEETLGFDGTLGRDDDTKEAVLTRDLRAALERLNPDLPASAIKDAVRNLTVYDVSRSLVQHNRDFYRMIHDGVLVEYRDSRGRPEIRPRPGDRLRQRAGGEPLPCRARTEAHWHPHAQLQPPRRSGLLRQRPAAGLHRVEGGLQEHPRGLRQQPLRLHARDRHRPRLPSQRLPGRVERRPRPLRLDHQRVGAFRRVEAARRVGPGQPASRGAAERHAGARPAAGHRRELHPVRHEQAGGHAQGHREEPPGAGRQPGAGVRVAAGRVEAGVAAGAAPDAPRRGTAARIPRGLGRTWRRRPSSPRGRSTSSSGRIPSSAGWGCSGTPRAAASPIPWPSSPRRCGGSWKAISRSC